MAVGSHSRSPTTSTRCSASTSSTSAWSCPAAWSTARKSNRVRIPLGVVDIVYAPRPVPERAALAVEDGFEHVDVLVDVDPATLALPVGCPTAFPKPRPGWCSTPAPRDEPGAWERTAALF